MTLLLAILAWLVSVVAPTAPTIPASQEEGATAATQPASAPAMESVGHMERRAFLELRESPYDALVLAAAEEHGLDPFALLALLWVESRLQPHVRHKRSGALGIAQLSAGGRHAIRRLTGRPFTRADALDPSRAIAGAATLLSHMRERCGARRMLGGYNTGRCVRQRGFEMAVERRARWYRGMAGLPWGR